MRADLSHEPLCKHGPDSRSDQRGFNVHVYHSHERAYGVFRMERCEYLVPGQRRLNRHVRGELVANLADYDDVGILSDDGSQCLIKGEADLFVDRALRDPVNYILDRVLAGYDLDRRIVAMIYGAVEGRRFSGARGPGDQSDSRRRIENILAVHPQNIRSKTELLKADQRSLIQYSKHDVLAKNGRVK